MTQFAKKKLSTVFVGNISILGFLEFLNCFDITSSSFRGFDSPDVTPRASWCDEEIS